MSNRPLHGSQARSRCSLREVDIDVDGGHAPRCGVTHGPVAADSWPRAQRAEAAARVVGNARGEGRDEELDRSRSGIVTAVTPRLVDQDVVIADGNPVAISADPDDGQLLCGFR